MTGSADAVLVTGSTSGIGRALAEALVASGASVGIVARDAGRGDAVRREIETTTGKGAARVFVADLASLEDLRRLAATVGETFPRLAAVVHCAAVFTRSRSVTGDGFETMMATNHLAPFLLTNLLLAQMTANPPARVLTLSAPSTVKLDFDDLEGEQKFRALTQFGATKAANLLFTFELARRLEGSGVTANAVHPGLARTNLMRSAPALLRWLTRIVSAPPDRVAAGIAPLVLAQEFSGRNGRFYKNGREINAPPYTRDPDVARRLWEVSAELTHLDPS